MSVPFSEGPNDKLKFDFTILLILSWGTREFMGMMVSRDRSVADLKAAAPGGPHPVCIKASPSLHR